MSLLTEWFIIKKIFGRDRAKIYLATRFLVGLCVAVPAYLVAIGYVLYWVFRELSLEAGYRQKYGAAWQAEFERYHGSLSHAHMKIVVCGVSMLALTSVLFFAFRIFFHKKRGH